MNNSFNHLAFKLSTYPKRRRETCNCLLIEAIQCRYLLFYFYTSYLDGLLDPGAVSLAVCMESVSDSGPAVSITCPQATTQRGSATPGPCGRASSFLAADSHYRESGCSLKDGRPARSYLHQLHPLGRQLSLTWTQADDPPDDRWNVCILNETTCRNCSYQTCDLVSARAKCVSRWCFFQVPVQDLLPQLDSCDVGKICVVIDLDETLVHSSFKASWFCGPFSERLIGKLFAVFLQNLNIAIKTWWWKQVHLENLSNMAKRF